MLTPCRKGPGGTPCGNAARGFLRPGECPRCHVAVNADQLGRLADAYFAAVGDSRTAPQPRRPPSLGRTVRCDLLLARTEFRSGCGGMKCRHGCKKGLPAVPGGYCQTCTSYVADEDGVGWLGGTPAK